MADKDDFDFWEQPESEEQQASAAAVEEELRRNLNDAIPAKQGSPRRLVLLLVLLVALAGAGAYFYLGGPPAPEAPTPAPPVKQPIALPPPPAVTEEAMVKTEQISPPPSAIETAAAMPAKSPEPVKTEAPPTKAEPVSAPPPAEQAAKVAPAKAASPKDGTYSLQAGAFLLKSNLREAEAKVRRLGYEPQVKIVHRTLPMTRLRLGAFFAEEGEAKLKELKTLAPEAFLIRQGEYVLVYAGSFQNLDRARRAADHLYEQGVRVEEETAAADVSLSLLSFGDFGDRSAAEQAAARVRAVGLEAIIRKNP